MGGAPYKYSSDDNLVVRSLNCNADGSRNENWNYLSNNFNSNNPALGVLAGNFLHFSRLNNGGFCFSSWRTSCPFHPPNIFPISSILIDKAIYFLVSKDLVSQRIIRRIFSKSVFFIAKPMKGSFLAGSKKLAVEIASSISINKLSIRWPRECL